MGKEEEDSYKEVSSTNCDALSALHNDMCKFVILNVISFLYDPFCASEVLLSCDVLYSDVVKAWERGLKFKPPYVTKPIERSTSLVLGIEKIAGKGWELAKLGALG